MYCKYCGKTVDDDSVFCVNCGNRINTENSTFFYGENNIPKVRTANKWTLGFILRIVGCYIIFCMICVTLVLFINMKIMDKTREGIGRTNYSVSNTTETADCDVEFGEFKVSNNGYTYDTSLEVIVTNASHKQKSFFITIEAIDEDGARIDTDMVMADRLNPEQKIKIEAFEYVPQNKIEQFKTAEFKVLEVQKY